MRSSAPLMIQVRRKSRNRMWSSCWPEFRLGALISEVERICERTTHNEPLHGCLRLEIPAYNLVPMWSVEYFQSILNHLKSAR